MKVIPRTDSSGFLTFKLEAEDASDRALLAMFIYQLERDKSRQAGITSYGVCLATTDLDNLTFGTFAKKNWRCGDQA